MASVTGTKLGTVPATMTPVGAGGVGALGAAATAARPVSPWPTRAVRACIDRVRARRAAVRLQHVRDDVRVRLRRAGRRDCRAASSSVLARRDRSSRGSPQRAEELLAREQRIRQLAQVRAVTGGAALLVGRAAGGGLLGREGERPGETRQSQRAAENPARAQDRAHRSCLFESTSERRARFGALAREQPAPQHGVVGRDAACRVQLYIEVSREQRVTLLASQVDVARHARRPWPA